MSNSADKDVAEYGTADLYATVGELLASDLGMWIVSKSLDRPKQVIRVIHNENSTSVQWYRNPDAPDGISAMVAPHDHPVMLYREKPTRVIASAEGDPS